MSIFTSFSYSFGGGGRKGNMALYNALVSNFVKSCKVGIHTQLKPPGSVLTEGGVMACTLGRPTPLVGHT